MKYECWKLVFGNFLLLPMVKQKECLGVSSGVNTVIRTLIMEYRSRGHILALPKLQENARSPREAKTWWA